MKSRAGEEFAEAEGAFELGGDQEFLAAAVIGVVEQRQEVLVASSGGFEFEDGALEGEAEARADVNGFGSGSEGRHNVLVGRRNLLPCGDCREEGLCRESPVARLEKKLRGRNVALRDSFLLQRLLRSLHSL